MSFFIVMTGRFGGAPAFCILGTEGGLASVILHYYVRINSNIIMELFDVIKNVTVIRYNIDE